MSDIDRIANIQQKISAVNGVDLIVVNSPNNPTGEIYSYQLIRQINNLLRDNPNMYALSDVVYERMTHPRNLVPTMFQLADESLRARIVGRLAKAGFQTKAPDATNFLLVDTGLPEGVDLVDEIFKKTGILMRSGESYGLPRNMLRLSAGACIVLPDKFAERHSFAPETIARISPEFSDDLRKHGGQISTDVRVLQIAIDALAQLRDRQPSSRCAGQVAESLLKVRRL